jgi:DNA polymerase III delta prime subunit
MRLKHLAKIVNNKLMFTDLEKWQIHVNSLDKEIVVVELSKLKDKRSDNINAYYWGVVVKLIAQYIGEAKDDTHEILKGMFLKRKKKIDELWISYTESTTKLTTEEMVEYISNIKQWAAEYLNVNIPDPIEKSL